MGLALYASAIATVATNAERATPAIRGMNDEISPGLETILKFRDVEGGGPTSFATASDLVERFARLLERQAQRSTPQLDVEIARGQQYLNDFFQRFFPQLGRFEDLVREFQRWQEQQRLQSEKASKAGSSASTTGTVGTANPSSSSGSLTILLSSLPIQQKVGGIR